MVPSQQKRETVYPPRKKRNGSTHSRTGQPKGQPPPVQTRPASQAAVCPGNACGVCACVCMHQPLHTCVRSFSSCLLGDAPCRGPASKPLLPFPSSHHLSPSSTPNTQKAMPARQQQHGNMEVTAVMAAPRKTPFKQIDNWVVALQPELQRGRFYSGRAGTRKLTRTLSSRLFKALHKSDTNMLIHAKPSKMQQ